MVTNTRPSSRLIAAAAMIASGLSPDDYSMPVADGRLADRSRLVKARGSRRDKNNIAIEGGAYRGRQGSNFVGNDSDEERMTRSVEGSEKIQNKQENERQESTSFSAFPETARQLRGTGFHDGDYEEPEQFSRRLSSQLTGCCYTYKSYSAAKMCSLYGQDCESGETPSHDSGDEKCEQDGLSFIGISFSVNTANGNPYSYQLCDQFPMENIIDRNYNYVMSMDEDGWLVGGGYKSFDYSGKMP